MSSKVDKVILIQSYVKDLLEGGYQGDLYEEVVRRLSKDLGLVLTREEVKSSAFPIMYGRKVVNLVKEVYGEN